MTTQHPGDAGGPAGPLARLYSCAEWVEETVIAYLLGAMTAIAFANVVVRRLFDGSIIWALELTLNLFLYLVLFGMSYVLRKGEHIGVDVIVRMLPGHARKWAEVTAGVISFLYATAFAVTGWLVAQKFLSSKFLRGVGSDELDIPHWFTYGTLSFGFAYLGFTVFMATLDVIRDNRTTITAGHEASQETSHEADEAADSR